MFKVIEDPIIYKPNYNIMKTEIFGKLTRQSIEYANYQRHAYAIFKHEYKHFHPLLAKWL